MVGVSYLCDGFPTNSVGQPKNPTASAFGRASTLSLGSIAFGSLIVTLLDLLRLILEAIRNSAAQDGNRECIFRNMGSDN